MKQESHFIVAKQPEPPEKRFKRIWKAAHVGEATSKADVLWLLFQLVSKVDECIKLRLGLEEMRCHGDQLSKPDGDTPQPEERPSEQSA